MMDLPLQVQEDEKGIFRDALDRPMIMVFNSNKKHAKKSKKACATPQTDANHTKPPLMFVQVDGAKKENRLERSKMRTHVMQNHFRQKKAKKTPLQKRRPITQSSRESLEASAIASNDHIEICAFTFQPTAGLDPFARTRYPIDMNARGYLLVHHFVTILVVSEKKAKHVLTTFFRDLLQLNARLTTLSPQHWSVPTGFGWADCFRAGLDDPALFHVILLSAAVHLQFVSNDVVSTEVAYHKLKAIQSVNDRLRNSPPTVSDHIIHAVMLMALNEGVGGPGGDMSAAKAHLDGLCRMIEIRGGLANLDQALQQKICFTDYICCVQPDEGPRFRFPPATKSFIANKIANPNIKAPIGFQNLQPVVPLDQEFLSIVVYVERFCIRFRQAEQNDLGNKLGPHDYDVTVLRYRLVCMENARKSTSHKELVGDACRVGTLIFFKTVFDHVGCWGPSHKIWAQPNKVLVEKLRGYLTRLDDSFDARRPEFLEWLLWLSFVGRLMQLESQNRKWYNAHIATTAAKLGLKSFHEVKEVLERFFWIEWVHERSCRDLWEDCQVNLKLAEGASSGSRPGLSALENKPPSLLPRDSVLSLGRSLLIRI